MQPRSIVTFERLYLAGLVVSLANFALAFGTISQATISGSTVNPAYLVVGFVIGFAIQLALWFMVARKASNIARWALVVIFILGLSGLSALVSPPYGLANVLGLGVVALHFAALTFLFRKDASDWLSRKGGSGAGE